MRDTKQVQRLETLGEPDGPAHGIELLKVTIAGDSDSERFHASAQPSAVRQKLGHKKSQAAPLSRGLARPVQVRYSRDGLMDLPTIVELRSFVRISLVALMTLGAMGLGGCVRSLDMAKAYDNERAATTIPYTGVREETRQYPDYSAINADILTAKKGGPSR